MLDCKKTKKKSQISLFVIFVAIVLVGFIFLLMSSSSQEIIEVETQFTDSIREEFNIYNLYEASQACLLLATRKATLLASSRGGLIYPHEHSIRFDSRLNSLDLSSTYLRNLNLNPDLLQEYVFPGLTEEYYLSFISPAKIRSELEHYITRDFVRCQVATFDSTQFSNLSYSVLDTSTRSSENDGNYSYEVGQFKGNSGDIIKLYLSNGSIIDSVYNSSTLRVKTPIFLGDEEIVVGVLDNEFSINVIGEEFRIISRIQTTDSFSASSTSVDRGDIEAVVNSPLFSLINDFRKIFNAKFTNRSINFQNESHMAKVSAERGITNSFRLNVRNLEKSEQEIFQELVITSREPRNFEFDSFVTLYRNTAPIIGNDRFEVTNSVLSNFLDNENYIHNITHNELEDYIFTRGREFEYFKDDNIIEVFPNGTFQLLTDSGFFTYTFFVTDGELYTPFEVTFNLGGQLNENNRDVGNCFSVTYNLGSLNRDYDQINRFIDNKTRGVNLQSVQTGSNYNWFGLVAAGQSNSVNVDIIPNPDCFETTPPSQTISISEGESQDISIQNLDGGDDFQLTIGAIDCMGPLPIGFDISNPNIKGSCCDIHKIEELLISSDFNDLISNNFIFPSGTVAIDDDEELFVCVEGPRASQLSNWGNANFLKTQILTSTLKVICQGNSPILEENLIQTTGDTLIGEYAPLDYPSNSVQVYANHNSFLDVCRECRMLGNEDTYVLQSGSARLSIGYELDDTFQVPTQFAQEDLFLETSSFTDRVLISGICYQRSYEYRCQFGQRVRVVANAEAVTLPEGELCT